MAPMNGVTDLTPTWDDDIKSFFVAPYWLPADSRQAIAAGWKEMMLKYGAGMPDGEPLTLDKYEHVKYQAKTIYEHCASRAMPITTDPAEYWPDEALNLFLIWVNQGCRENKNAAVVQSIILMPVSRDAPVFRVRKDVRDLTPLEIQTFRAKVQDVLKCDQLKSPWQENGELHAWWCLHYQEATFFWHRAWLKYVEELIGFPIPYWNIFAPDAADPTSQYSGLPQIFLDDEYVHPDGTTRKNPLKYSLAYQGRSKNGKSEYVQRDPILEAGRPTPDSAAFPAWQAKVAWFKTYSKQVMHSLSMSHFSAIEGIGVAWDNLPLFKENMEDKWYASQQSFDGWFEQVHDNGHGWVGGLDGDMSDNTYTAMDPVFLAYHCNLDRMFDKYLRAHPTMQTSANFPLQPFINNATALDYTNPNRWAYTTLGDMGKPTQALGYVYAPPAGGDPVTLPRAVPLTDTPGGKSISLLTPPPSPLEKHGKEAIEAARKTPMIVFEDVACTPDSYNIDIFLAGAKSTEPNLLTNPDFVGRVFRFGMGRPVSNDGAEQQMRNSSRCSKPSVTRALSAEAVADRIADGFFTVVTKSGDDEPLPEAEWKAKKGFTGQLVWIVDI